jgi:hypothetical protein
MAAEVYAEQLGTKRQERGRKGDRKARYPIMRPITALCKIRITIFSDSASRKKRP